MAVIPHVDTNLGLVAIRGLVRCVCIGALDDDVPDAAAAEGLLVMDDVNNGPPSSDDASPAAPPLAEDSLVADVGSVGVGGTEEIDAST